MYTVQKDFKKDDLEKKEQKQGVISKETPFILKIIYLHIINV